MDRRLIRRLFVVEPIIVTVLPVLFLIVLFGGGALFRRRSIDMDGEPPIGKGLFYSSKYAILVLWGAMVLHSWGIGLVLVEVPGLLRRVALVLWAGGFVLLFIGRLGLGDSFRIGSAKESTSLRTGGLFRFSRNPMYAGVDATLLACVFYTLNPILLLAGAFVAVVHHNIILAEEQHLQEIFGEEYAEYCHRVRRYL
jgi:protein-S-isoprenylcysteine O-methyltransferase Ste14